MIKKTLITSLLLVLLYAVLVKYCFSHQQVIQHQWQGNLINAENYLYNTANSKKVLLGSSLSYRMLPADLPGITNLSFAGLGIFDGLALMQSKAQYPDTLFIEMNLALRNPDPAFVSDLLHPYGYYSKKWLPFLRNGKQPVGLFVNQLSSWILPGKKQSGRPAINTTVTETVFQKVLVEQVKLYAISPGRDSIQHVLIRLKKQLASLEARGVKVIFFEMPVHPSLTKSLFASDLRYSFEVVFPVTNYTYILPPDNIRFHTTDGIHLARQEVQQYVRYFKSKM